MTYRLTNSATDDLLAILLDGIDRFGIAKAHGYRLVLERSFELLGDHPRIARVRSELPLPLRVKPVASHIILYDIEDDETVLILRIRHGREDWTSDPL